MNRTLRVTPVVDPAGILSATAGVAGAPGSPALPPSGSRDHFVLETPAAALGKDAATLRPSSVPLFRADPFPVTTVGPASGPRRGDVRVKLPKAPPAAGEAAEAPSPDPEFVTTVTLIMHLLDELGRAFLGAPMDGETEAQIRLKVEGILTQSWASEGEDQEKQRLIGVLIALKSSFSGLPDGIFMGFAQGIRAAIHEHLPVEVAENILTAAVANLKAKIAAEGEGAEKATSAAAPANKPSEYLTVERVREAVTATREYVMDRRDRGLTISLSPLVSLEVTRNPNRTTDADGCGDVIFYVYTADNDEFNRVLREDVAVIHQGIAFRPNESVSTAKPTRVFYRFDFIRGVTRDDGRGFTTIEIFYKGILHRVSLPVEGLRAGF